MAQGSIAIRNIAHTEGIGGRMISKLTISRFKSIKQLSLDCKRVNIFIGEPNTGKSNILEAIALLSFASYSRNFGYNARDFIRFERTGNLFYDEELNYPLEVKGDAILARMQYKDGGFKGQYISENSEVAQFFGSHEDFYIDRDVQFSKARAFKAYRFRVQQGAFSRPETDFLLPPYGDNLLSLLLANKELRAIINQPFTTMRLRLGVRTVERKLEVIKQVEDIIVSFPYWLTSETLQRLTFFVAAILSNKDSVLAFEEPESHAFPYYTKYLAEQIALDRQGNQYFITTHNPYFLLPILEKADKSEVAVHITYFEDYQTKVKALSEKELAEFSEIDVFSNIDRYLKVR